MKKIAVYIRVSTFDQEKGLLSQEKALTDYCNNHGFKNLIWYRDKISGAKTDRPAFNKMQKAIFMGGFLVHNLVHKTPKKPIKKGLAN